ncbi:Hypothetical protein CINCED_3A023311 [Cinara cedri]|uniref:Uncharacterized protein n=1 Tax=Cinara cedri TaxID=506608 RepID=A0A5E4NPP8_9HEMI|nr:Hypothetical protein CINCED_3A023311 [Cinara cedri]
MVSPAILPTPTSTSVPSPPTSPPPQRSHPPSKLPLSLSPPSIPSNLELVLPVAPEKTPKPTSTIWRPNINPENTVKLKRTAHDFH